MSRLADKLGTGGGQMNTPDALRAFVYERMHGPAARMNLAKGWYWYTVEKMVGNQMITVMGKFDVKYLGSSGYICEDPARAMAYLKKAIGDFPGLNHDIISFATNGKLTEERN